MYLWCIKRFWTNLLSLRLYPASGWTLIINEFCPYKCKRARLSRDRKREIDRKIDTEMERECVQYYQKVNYCDKQQSGPVEVSAHTHAHTQSVNVCVSLETSVCVCLFGCMKCRFLQYNCSNIARPAAMQCLSVYVSLNTVISFQFIAEQSGMSLPYPQAICR